MSDADEFRQYAEEAMRWAINCKDPQEKLVLMSLARTWLKAVGRSVSPVVVKKPPPEHRAAQARLNW
jgi:hypothetical protein